MRLFSALTICLIFFAIFTSAASAHPGRTDANGGHTCRTNCEKWGYGYGEYHSHNGGGSTGGSTAVQQPVYPTATPIPVVKKQIFIPTATPTLVPTATPTLTLTPTPVPYKESPMDKKKQFQVLRVISGDTIVVNIRGKEEVVKLIGTDGPEAAVCFGKAAKDKLTALVQGKYVVLVADKKIGNRDISKFLLRYVYLPDTKKTFINGELIKQGYAFSTKDKQMKMITKFTKLEDNAKKSKVGLWGSCTTR